MLSVALCGGCLAPHEDETGRRSAIPLPQLIRLYTIQQVRRQPGSLYIAGGGSAAADGGKYDITKPTPLSSHPYMEITVTSDNDDELKACKQRVEAARDNHQYIDIRGAGAFRLESRVDPPLDTGIFTLKKLVACGQSAAPASTPSPAPTVTAPPGATSAADLIAVPERYLDHPTTVFGRLAAPVKFTEPVGSLSIQSEGQFLSCYFTMQALPAEARLSLVHAPNGSTLVLGGTLTRGTPGSLSAKTGSAATGYELDIDKVLSVQLPQ
ncbi:MAG TPA: hypothetical protein VMU17_06060 [Elusimicrobiota bacterium]|nr:hypothetical protein [Elusimicrobiota bacterium]